MNNLSHVDVQDWSRWEFCEGLLETRREAIDAAKDAINRRRVPVDRDG